MTHFRAALARHSTIDTFLLVGMCLIVFATAAATRTYQNALVVKSLEFRDGHFYQDVHPVTQEVILGRWAAEIVDLDGLNMCSGGGSAPYEIRTYPKVMSPNDWTGDDCALQDGTTYWARAVWQWEGEDGLSHSVSRSLQFTYQPPEGALTLQ